MKKILFTIILLLSISPTYAEEIDITNDIEIKTKWYKEEIEDTYYKKGEPLEGYIEDQSRISYSKELEWSEEYCTGAISDQKRVLRVYKLLEGIRYIVLDRFNYNNNVIILYKGMPYRYEIQFQNEEKVTFKLVHTAEPNNLIIIVDTNEPFNITLTSDHTQLLYKQVRNEKVLIPNNTWMLLNDSYEEVVRIDSEEKGGFVTLLTETRQCAKQEEKTYRYKINRTYYDNEYHSFIEGYLPDYTDYKVYYKGKELIKENIKYIKGDNIIKYIKGEDKITYVETCSNEESEPIKEIEYKYIDNSKVIEKTPKKIKYILFGLISIILFFIYICLKMSSEKYN